MPRAGLTLRQNKHVIRASRRKGAPQNSGHKSIYFISQIVGSRPGLVKPKTTKFAFAASPLRTQH